jgi:hypothetical protein
VPRGILQPHVRTQWLGNQILQFEQALATQDPRQVAPQRQRFEKVIAYSVRGNAPHRLMAMIANRLYQLSRPARLSSKDENPPVDTAASTWLIATTPLPDTSQTTAMPVTVNAL